MAQWRLVRLTVARHSLGAVPWRARGTRAVLFDLDGTLLDTAGDIAVALNRALAERGLSAVPLDVVRTLVGRGARVLVERALALAAAGGTPPSPEPLVARYLFHAERLYDTGEASAAPFPGVRAALGQLRERRLSLAVVTNKQRRLAVRALDANGLLAAFELVQGGDSCARIKPDPEPLLQACRGLGIAPPEALMVGDSANDVMAARAAGMAVVCVRHGYNAGQPVEALPVDALIGTLDELPGLVDTDGRVDSTVG